MPTTRTCPACGAPVVTDTVLCGVCHASLSPAAGSRSDAGAAVPALPARRAPGTSAPVTECWSCGASNVPSRTFCVDCGAFIGSNATAAPEPARGSGLTAAPAASLVTASIPTAAGAAAPVSYQAALRRTRTQGRWRRLIAVVSVAFSVAVGMAAVQVATDAGGGPDEPGSAAALFADPAGAPAPDTAASARTSTPAASSTPTGEPLLSAGPGRDDTDVSLPDAPAADGSAASTDASIPDRRVRRDGWVCGGGVTLQDPRDRDWSLGRASFVAGAGYERVILHLDRLGPGSGEPSSVTAKAFATARIRQALPGVRKPSSGRTTMSLLLADGIRGDLGLRGYRPTGLRTLREFSVYPAGRGASRVLVSVASGGCFRLRVPAWSARGGNVRTAKIILDVKS